MYQPVNIYISMKYGEQNCLSCCFFRLQKNLINELKHPSPNLHPPITRPPSTHHQTSTKPSTKIHPVVTKLQQLITKPPPADHQTFSHPSPNRPPPITKPHLAFCFSGQVVDWVLCPHHK